MFRGKRGRYKVPSTGGETVRAFVPGSLPPRSPLHEGPACKRSRRPTLPSVALMGYDPCYPTSCTCDASLGSGTVPSSVGGQVGGVPQHERPGVLGRTEGLVRGWWDVRLPYAELVSGYVGRSGKIAREVTAECYLGPVGCAMATHRVDP